MSLSGKWIAIIFSFLIMTSCAQRDGLAPVEELTKWKAVGGNRNQHVVTRGETLYAIAFRYDQDYRQLAALNHLPAPYAVRVGQVIQLRGFNSSPQLHTSRQRPVHQYKTAPRFTPSYSFARPPTRGTSSWLWPARGRIVSSFYPAQGKKGVDIAGKKGDKIRAAAGGVVAYAGNGLSGYGNLIIIKHNNQFLTAYGNNARNLVREGQNIKAGDIIAEMGIVDRKYWGVHFEIRNTGQPVNPLNYLEKG